MRMPSLLFLFSLLSIGSSFILFPEDLQPLLLAIYSRIPPVRFGMNNTKVGLGYRIGRNVDLQFLVELGPQDAPRPTDSTKRAAPISPNPETTVQNLRPTVQNAVTTVQNRWAAIQNAVTTVQNQWPTVQNPVTTDKPPVVIPVDFISRLSRRRPGITAPTTSRPTKKVALSTEFDIKENEIDVGS